MADHPLDLTSLRRAYAEGLEPAALIDAVYDRIEAAADPGVFITLIPRATAKAAAAALGPRADHKPLWGAPFVIKDNIDVAGLPTTCACPAFAYEPEADAPAVARLLAAGAICLGKTNLDQFATGLVGLRTPYPAPKNPFDGSIVPGGSSSGSAVAVARGFASFALGTDTAGSGRVPAGLNNIVGLKPSLGAVSGRGMVPACRSLDTISIFSLTVADAWAVFETVAAYDAQDPFSRPLTLARPGALPPVTTLGVPREQDLAFFEDAAAEEAWRRALERLRALPARLVEIDMAPFLETARLLYDGPWVAERLAALRPFFMLHRDEIHPVTRRIVEGGARFGAADAYDGLYALMARRRESAAALAGVDALCVPTTPTAPSVAEVEADPLGPNARLGTWTNFVNLLDLAALAVPGPFRRDGIPAGVTFIGARGRDARLAALGQAFHAMGENALGATGWRPPVVSAAPAGVAPPDGMIEIVVVGAHLSGMPLNHQLTERDGVFLRAVDTEPCYRLFALPGGPPKKPGLARVKDGEGAAIATEVWALEAAEFGRFVESLPPPMAIGVVRLADGTAPKGFLAEAEGLAGARDITSYGGWRAFVAAS